MTNPLWLIPVLAPVLLVLGVGVSIIVRNMRSRGGFAMLLRRYSTKMPAPEGALVNQTAQIGTSSWKQRVTIGISQRGLYLHPKPPLLRYSAIEIPWSHMRFEGAGTLEGIETARVSVVPPAVTLAVPKEVWDKTEAYPKHGAS